MPVVPNKYRGTVEYSTVYAELVFAARCRGLVTYQELALAIGFPTEGNYLGAEIGHLLGEISDDEHGHSRPMLSAIAVGVSDLPGPGFFDLARQLGKLNSQIRQDERDFWERERQAVYNTWRRVIRT
jgi:hypothetical protein